MFRTTGAQMHMRAGCPRHWFLRWRWPWGLNLGAAEQPETGQARGGTWTVLGVREEGLLRQPPLQCLNPDWSLHYTPPPQLVINGQALSLCGSQQRQGAYYGVDSVSPGMEGGKGGFFEFSPCVLKLEGLV